MDRRHADILKASRKGVRRAGRKVREANFLYLHSRTCYLKNGEESWSIRSIMWNKERLEEYVEQYLTALAKGIIVENALRNA